jgi:hypothetical protein
MTRADDDERRDDLAATSESLQGDAQRVVDIEREKQDLDAANPRVDTLSIEAERLAGQIQEKSRIERELADDIERNESPGRSN